MANSENKEEVMQEKEPSARTESRVSQNYLAG